MGCINGNENETGGVRLGGITPLKEVLAGTDMLLTKVTVSYPPLDDGPVSEAIRM